MSFVSFEDTFFPSEENIKKQSSLLQKLINEERAFFIERGLTPKEVDILIKLEEQESSEFHQYQSYSSRKSLLGSNIITIDQVKAEIEAFE